MTRTKIQVMSILSLLLLSGGCKNSESGNSGLFTTPPATPSTAREQPAAAASPLPPFSAAQKIGMFAYPKNKQTSEQQLKDEYDCYTEVQQQTGINPDTPPPSAPSSADMQSVQQQASQSASSQLQHQYSQAKSAYNHQMDTFKRGFSACMDARDYSVK